MLNLNGFQACDVRGTFGAEPGAEISPLLAYRIGRSLARRLAPDAGVQLSGDGRASTPALLTAVAAGLGRACLNLGGGVPTPLAYFTKHLRQIHTSIIVTASHNPPAFNGLKLQLGELPITPDELAAIRDDVAADRATEVPVPADIPALPVDAEQVRESWRAYSMATERAFNHGRGEALAIDCMHGCYAGYASPLLTRLGYRVTALRDTPDAAFCGITPDPAVDRNLEPLRSAVTAGTFVFGAALDGDGDRARFVDEHGTPIDNGTALAIFARYLLASGRNHGRTNVVYDQKTRLAVVRALRQCGAEPVMEKSGHTFIRTRMLAENALFGGEKSGHFFWGGGEIYPVSSGDCGLFAVVAMANVLRFFGRPLSALAAEIPDSPFYTGDIRGLRYAGDRQELLAQVAAKVSATGFRISTDDGVRIESDDAFAHLRASVTENGMLTAAFDAADSASLRAVARLVVDALPADAAELGRQLQARIMPG